MFIDDGEVNLEVASIGFCKLYAPNIGGNNNKVVMPYHLTGGVSELLPSVEIIYRDIKKSLELFCMEIHGDNTCGSGSC